MVSFYITCQLFFISEVQFKLSCTQHGFWRFPKMLSILNLWSKTKIEFVRKCLGATYRVNICFHAVRWKWWLMAISTFGLFLSWWCRQRRHECMRHNLYNYTFPTIYVKYIVLSNSASQLNRLDRHHDKHTRIKQARQVNKSRVIIIYILFRTFMKATHGYLFVLIGTGVKRRRYCHRSLCMYHGSDLF